MDRLLQPLILSDEQRAGLSSLAARRKTAQALALQAKVVLLASEGPQNKDVAARLDIDPATADEWRKRFLTAGLDGLRDEPR